MVYATENAGSVSSVNNSNNEVSLTYDGGSKDGQYIFRHRSLTAGSSWTSSYVSDNLFKVENSTSIMHPQYSSLQYNTYRIIYNPSYTYTVSFTSYVSGVVLSSNYVCTINIYGLI